jgi:ribosomal protein L35AE/L33A
MVPRPNQNIRITMIQEMDMDMSSANGQALPGGLRMSMITTSVITQKTGAPKPDGSLDAEMRYEEVRAAMTMNGQSQPAAEVANQLVGKVVTVTYRDGKVVESRLPDGFGTSGDVVKQLLAAFSGNLPSTMLGVGEVVSVPIDLGLPLPLPGALGLTIEGETKITLASIDKDASGRSARFESTTDGTMTVSGPADAKSAVGLNYTISGTGTTVMDLDGGFVRSGQVKARMSGKMTAPTGAGSPQMPAMNLDMSLRITFTGTKE